MKITILIVSLLLLSGCGKANSQVDCRNSVVKDVGTDDVVNLPRHEYTWIARKADGSVWCYTTQNIGDAEVDSKKLLLGPTAK